MLFLHYAVFLRKQKTRKRRTKCTTYNNDNNQKRPAGDIVILVGYTPMGLGVRQAKQACCCCCMHLFYRLYRLLTCVFEFSKLLLFPRRASDPEVWVSKRVSGGFPKAILTDECASDCIWTCLFHLSSSSSLQLPSSTLLLRLILI